VPLLDRRVEHRAEQHHPGVVHEDVEPTQLLHRALHPGVCLVLVGEVNRKRERGPVV
jgi:hypothetical protein